jgi:hypothetical protein
MSRLGHSFPVSDDVRPIRFARFLEKVKGTRRRISSTS